MNDIKTRARELLAAEFNPEGREQFERGQAVVVTTASALNAIIAALTPPEEPDDALLVSMAMLVYHGFVLLTPEQKQSQLREMRKLWDEVVGRGYYSPDNRERYVAILADRSEVP